MRTVLIAGAGMSLAQAAGYRRQQRLEHPPLDVNFFERATALADRKPTLRASVRTLRNEIAANDLFYDPFQHPGTSLEQFFADVYYHVAGERSGEAFSVFVALLRLYAGVLGATTNWMLGEGRNPGLVGKLLRKEVALAAGDKPTILTFNHDLVIESEIARLPRLEDDRWCLGGLYGDLELARLWAPGNVPYFPHHDEDCEHDAPVLLLKLHGSLNWVVRQVARNPAMNTLFPTSSQHRSMFITDRRTTTNLTGEITIRSHGGGRQRWYGFPVIVPPIYDKQSITGTGIFQDVWDKAARAIREAEKLVLVGYSLPDADVIARQMLRRAFAASRLKAVECINPDAGIAGKLKTLLSCPVIHLYDGLESYLSSG